MSGGRGKRGNREVSPLRQRPRQQSWDGLCGDIASDVAVLSARGVPRRARAEARLKEGGAWGKHGFPHGSEPQASDGHAPTASRTSPNDSRTMVSNDVGRTPSASANSRRYIRRKERSSSRKASVRSARERAARAPTGS